MERKKRVEYGVAIKELDGFDGFCLKKLSDIRNRATDYIGSKERSKDFGMYV
jgi:hypothetical protein